LEGVNDTTSKYVIVAVTKISGTKMPSVKMNDESVRKYIRMLSSTRGRQLELAQAHIKGRSTCGREVCAR